MDDMKLYFSPRQRAAVILSLMDEAVARSIINRMNPESVLTVQDALREVAYLSRERLTAIVLDFLESLQREQGAWRGGDGRLLQLVDSLVGARMGRGEGATEADDEGMAGTGSVWSRLGRCKPEEVADYLSGLTPNLVALVMRQLDPGVSADIVGRIDPEMLRPTMEQLVSAPPPTPVAVEVIGRMIEMEFLNRTNGAEDEAEAYLERVGELLTLMPADNQNDIVNYLRGEHGEKLERIERAMLTLDALPDILPRASVPVVFREFDQNALVALMCVLRSTHPAVAEFLLGNISSRLADNVRSDMETVPVPGAQQSETIIRNFLKHLLSLRQKKLITLAKPEAGNAAA